MPESPPRAMHATMPLDPDTYDKLEALWRRFDSAPEVKFIDNGAVLRTDAYLAFLDARLLIEKARHDLFHATRHWRPIATFHETEPETPTVLLWAIRPETGEWSVMMGYYDEDARAWYREGQGEGDAPIEPTKWMRLADLSVPEDEFVTVPQMDAS